jgi:hypothetical protein
MRPGTRYARDGITMAAAPYPLSQEGGLARAWVLG